MEYKLAKELKDKGFQWDNRNSFGDDSEPRAEMYPTLSELIEACGEGFSSLINWGNRWGAYSAWDYDGPSNEEPNAEGKTPEEAVARLWIALQT